MITSESFDRIKNDTNGNPRFVIHFLSLTKPNDLEGYKGWDTISRKYNIALARAKKYGGRKFHNRQYGGGIAFTSYNLRELSDRLNDEMRGE